jgi:integrase
VIARHRSVNPTRTARRPRISERARDAQAPPPSAGKCAITVRVCLGTRRAAIGARFSRMIERAAIAADLGIKAHAHMLRHACGYKLANDGHDTRAIQAYLGHRNIQNTTRYTALAPQRFKEFFRD